MLILAYIIDHQNFLNCVQILTSFLFFFFLKGDSNATNSSLLRKLLSMKAICLFKNIAFVNCIGFKYKIMLIFIIFKNWSQSPFIAMVSNFQDFIPGACQFSILFFWKNGDHQSDRIFMFYFVYGVISQLLMYKCIAHLDRNMSQRQ